MIDSDSLHDSVIEDTITVAPNALPPLGEQKRFAYITLITQSSYLAGVVLLAHTLKKHGSKYPLIVLWTGTLTESAVKALELEVKYSNIILKYCDHLVPSKHHQVNVAVSRFTDTWTKLRVFEQFRDGYEALCYLDADMTIHKHMDVIFEKVEKLPEGYIAAVHDCVCSPDRKPWTPDDHNKANCPLKPQYHPKALTDPMPVKSTSRATYQLFNSGMFLFRPKMVVWQNMLNFFNTTDLLGGFRFPDQDFMTYFFRGRWMSIGWQFNAVKTMAYRHQNLWRIDEVVCLHYIVDKPWTKRVGDDGIAGEKGLDGETHELWWKEYNLWYTDRQLDGEEEVVTIVSKHVARPDGTAIDEEVHSLADFLKRMVATGVIEREVAEEMYGEMAGELNGELDGTLDAASDSTSFFL